MGYIIRSWDLLRVQIGKELFRGFDCPTKEELFRFVSLTGNELVEVILDLKAGVRLILIEYINALAFKCLENHWFSK